MENFEYENTDFCFFLVVVVSNETYQIQSTRNANMNNRNSAKMCLHGNTEKKNN